MSAPTSLSLRVKAPSLQVFHRRHVGDDAAALHHLEDAAADDLVGIDAVDALAVEDDLAAGDFAVFGLEQAGDRLQRRRFAGAVGAEQRHDRALRHLEAQAAQHQDDVVIDHLDVAHGEQRRSGGAALAEARRFDGFGHDARSCCTVRHHPRAADPASTPAISETPRRTDRPQAASACVSRVRHALTSRAIRPCAAGRWS